MSYGSSHSSHARSLLGLFLPLVALFVLAVSIGTGSALVFWLGVALGVGTVGYHGMGSLGPRRALRSAEGRPARVAGAGSPPVARPVVRPTAMVTPTPTVVSTPTAESTSTSPVESTSTARDDEWGSPLEEFFRSERGAGGEGGAGGSSLASFDLPEFTLVDLPEFALPASPGAALGGTSFQGVGASLTVSDLPQSLSFYRDTLGFTEVDSGADAAILAVGDAKLLLHQLADAPKEGLRLSHVNLEVADVDAMYEQLRTKGVHFPQRPRSMANTELVELRSVDFRDPDGHRLALTSWRFR